MQGEYCVSREEGEHTGEKLRECGRESMAREGKGKWCPHEVQAIWAKRLWGRKRSDRTKW